MFWLDFEHMHACHSAVFGHSVLLVKKQREIDDLECAANLTRDTFEHKNAAHARLYDLSWH